MTLRISDLQSVSDLDSIRNSCDVFKQPASNQRSLCPKQQYREISKNQRRKFMMRAICNIHLILQGFVQKRKEKENATEKSAKCAK